MKHEFIPLPAGETLAERLRGAIALHEQRQRHHHRRVTALQRHIASLQADAEPVDDAVSQATAKLATALTEARAQYHDHRRAALRLKAELHQLSTRPPRKLGRPAISLAPLSLMAD